VRERYDRPIEEDNRIAGSGTRAPSDLAGSAFARRRRNQAARRIVIGRDGPIDTAHATRAQRASRNALQVPVHPARQLPGHGRAMSRSDRLLGEELLELPDWYISFRMSQPPTNSP
jgi:hypothetical protein